MNFNGDYRRMANFPVFLVDSSLLFVSLHYSLLHSDNDLMFKSFAGIHKFLTIFKFAMGIRHYW